MSIQKNTAISFPLFLRLRTSQASRNRYYPWFFFLSLPELKLFSIRIIFGTYGIVDFFDDFFCMIFFDIFFYVIFDESLTNFLTKFLTNFFDEVCWFDQFFFWFFFGRFLLTYNLLTIASFRIGVPAILFFEKIKLILIPQVRKSTTHLTLHN